MKRQFKYKVYHLPSGNVFYKTVEHFSVHEGIPILGYSSFMELMNRWNYMSSLQPTLQWVYIGLPD